MLKLWAALSGSKTYLVGLAGIIAPIAAAIHGDMTYEAAAGVVTPALLAMCVRHGISSSVATIAAAVLSNAAQAADVAKKTAPVLLAVLAAGLLSACASLGLTGNPANDLPILSADAIKAVSIACTEAQPFEAAALLTPDPKVQVIAGTLAGGCDVATGTVTPVLAAKIDPSTEAWIRASVGMLQTLGVQPVAPPVVAPAKAS